MSSYRVPPGGSENVGIKRKPAKYPSAKVIATITTIRNKDTSEV